MKKTNVYYNKQGKQITLNEWGSLHETEYKIIEQTTLPNGKWVSTVWLGIDHNFGEGDPEIFETMVFPLNGDSDEDDCDRYSTLEQAIAGHKSMCDKWK